jgi:polyhydroxyalkanoate synthesis repressor PhaR
MDTDADTITLKRYASRRLYDAGAKAYVTLEDIAKHIAEGRNVRVVDQKTGEDLTSQYLLQIIAEQNNQGAPELPVSVLTDLVRMYQQQASALTPSFLSDVVAAFNAQQQKVVKDLEDLGRRVVGSNSLGEPILAMIDDWQATQQEFFRSMMRAWETQADTATSPDGEDEAASAASAKSKAEKIADIEKRIAELQRQADELR